MIDVRSLLTIHIPGRRRPLSLGLHLPEANFTVANSSQEIIAICTDDVCLAPDALELAERFLLQNSHVDAVTGVTTFASASAIASVESAAESPDVCFYLLVRKDAFVRAGGFNEWLPVQADVCAALLARLKETGANVRSCDQISAVFRASPSLTDCLRGQCRLGSGSAYYSTGSVFRRIVTALAAPLRATRIADPDTAATALVLSIVATFIRLVGFSLAKLQGGAIPDPRLSTLIADRSPMLLGPQSKDIPFISVIIPVKGLDPCLKLCLSALLRQDVEEFYEVIVVVERGDPLQAQLSKEHPQLRVLTCEVDMGPGGTRNHGIKSARGQYIAFTDADCLCERDWLRNIVRACRENRSGPVAGWMACGFPSSYVARASCLADFGTARPQKPRTTPGIWGSNMCIAKSLLENVPAPFAERVYGAEEIVFLKNLPADTPNVVLTPAAQVRHMRQYKLGKSPHRMYRLGLGAGLMRRTRNLRGSLLARHRWLIPMLPLARISLAAWRVARYSGPDERLDFIRLAPLVFYCWSCYSVGFAVGASGYIEKRF